MSSQHTQGKWEFESQDNGGFCVFVENGGHDGGIIILATRSSHPSRKDEMHANGVLMAAAPDLLAALKAIIKKNDNNMRLAEEDGKTVIRTPEYQRLYDQCSAAIAKAEGRSA